MDAIAAMECRHSVRKYTDKPLEEETAEELRREIDACNAEGCLNIQLVTDDRAFTSVMSGISGFQNVRSYISMVGPKGDDLDEAVGWYGERLVLKAQSLGLNTCWVGLSFSKRKCLDEVGSDQKRVCVIAVGYGAEQGIPHRSRDFSDVARLTEDAPEWFRRGVEYALLAPTAINQQRFMFELSGNRVRATTRSGFFSKVDLGIARYHFEMAAGKENFEWE